MNLMKTLVYKNLRLNKKRTIVTIVGIILATALLAALTTLVSSFYYSIIKYEKSQRGDYHYSFSNVSTQELKDFENNRSIESLFEITGIGYSKLDGCKNEDKPYAYVEATDENGFKKAGFDLIEGRMAQNDNEIVIPRHLKTNGRIDYKVGDEITLNIGVRRVSESALSDEESNGDKAGTSGDDSTQYAEKQPGDILGQDTPYLSDGEELTDTVSKTYKVVGMIERPNYGFEDYSACGYTFITYEKQAITENDAYGMTVYARYTQKGLRNRYEVTAAVLGVDKELFKSVNDGNADFSGQQIDEYQKQLNNVKYVLGQNDSLIRYECLYPMDGLFKALFVIAAIVAFIIILTSVYCIKNSFSISITEKIRQYGMLSSIGATKRQIRKSVKTEAAMLGIVGIPIGIGSGVLAAYVLTKVANIILSEWLGAALVFNISVPALVFALLLAVITIYFSAIGSARKAAKVTPLEAIRNTNEIKLKAEKFKTPRFIGRIWGIGGIVSYKNIKRNNRKYRTTIVSIAICSVTFIVTSYFMSMAYHLVEMSYEKKNYNIDVNITPEGGEMSNDTIVDAINSISGVKDYDVTKTYYFDVDDPDMTKEYGDYYKEYYMADNSKAVNAVFEIAVMDDDSFAAYSKNAGFDDTDGKAILINRGQISVLNEETNKYTDKEIRLFNYKAGDTISLGYTADTREDEVQNTEPDENDTDETAADLSEQSDEGIRKTVDVTLAGVTDERPFGYEQSFSSPVMVMDQKTFDSLWKDGKCDYEGRPYQVAYVNVEDADKYQDDLETLMSDMQKTISFSYNITNYDAIMKNEKAFYMLIGIFAYGLIIVISLIGITNIINTLGTGMELRKREFATLRSIGMTDKQFTKMIRLESLFISVKALIIGIPAGLIISYIICRIENRLDTVIIYDPPAGAVCACIIVVILLIYAIMFLSMEKLKHNNIIDTIKNENL